MFHLAWLSSPQPDNPAEYLAVSVGWIYERTRKRLSESALKSRSASSVDSIPSHLPSRSGRPITRLDACKGRADMGGASGIDPNGRMDRF